MRLRGVLFLLSIVGVVSLAMPVQAAQLSASQKINIRAEVLPAITVIVGADGKIVSIASNSTQTVSPTFYRNAVSADTTLPATDNLLSNYRQFIASQPLRIGTLYDRKKTPTVTTRPKASLSFFSYGKAGPL